MVQASTLGSFGLDYSMGTYGCKIQSCGWQWNFHEAWNHTSRTQVMSGNIYSVVGNIFPKKANHITQTKAKIF